MRAQIKLTESYPVELNGGTTFMQAVAVRYGMVWAVGSTEAIDFCRVCRATAGRPGWGAGGASGSQVGVEVFGVYLHSLGFLIASA